MKKCRIAIAGLGVVGAETARHLIENRETLSQKAGMDLQLSAVSARSKGKDRGFDLSGLNWCDDPVALAQLDEIDVVVELMGGSAGPAKFAVEEAIKAAAKGLFLARRLGKCDRQCVAQHDLGLRGTDAVLLRECLGTDRVLAHRVPQTMSAKRLSTRPK